MNDLMMLAYHHSYGGGWTDWMAHVAVSSLIHALIYSVVFRVMHQFTLGEAVGLVALALCCLSMWGRSRDRRGW